MSKLSLNSENNIKLIKELSYKCFPEHRIVAELTIAQAILESALWKKDKPSDLALRYCNLFGQKASQTIAELKKGTQGIIYLKTWEHIKGKDIEITDGFLYNKEIEDSLEQHKLLFTKLYRYQNLFLCTSFEQAAKMIALDGYATDALYPQKLIDTFNKYIKQVN